ncbi:MAG: ABC transporter substrate-binding protein [Deltaproteobacteria bacterium]|nr:ABC transporter substrate-binding protein [Deltaproteobacteria bacterium]
MRKTGKSWLVFTAAILALSLILGGAISVQAAEKTLKIGVIMPISGPISVVGITLSRAIEMAFDKVNETGGLQLGGDTYKIKTIVEDSKLSPDAAVTATRKLIHKDKVDFVMGAILSHSAAAINQVTEPAGVLHVITWIDVPGHPGDVNPDKPLAVRLVISSDSMYEMDYDYLKKTYPQAKRVVMVYPDLGYEKMIERAKGVAAERGIEIVAAEKWQFGITDFMPLCTKALGHKPDAIHCMVSAQSNYVLRVARQLGFEGPFFSDSPLGPEVILRTAGAEACDQVFCNGMDLGHPTPAMQDVMDRWQAKYEEPFISDAFLTWDEAWILVQALKKADSVDPAKVAAAFDQLTAPGSLMTTFGPGHMGGKERFGVTRVLTRPVPISTIIKGQIGLASLKMPVIE